VLSQHGAVVQCAYADAGSAVEDGGGGEAAKMAAEATKVGDPFVEGTGMGPLVSQSQFDKVQRLIHQGIEEGARLVTGGLGKPEGFSKGTS